MRDFIHENVSQEFLLKNSLDLIDALLLDYILNFMASGHCVSKLIDGKCFWWISINKILEDLPIICISKRAMRRRIQFLEYKKCLERRQVKREMYLYISQEIENAMYYGNKIE